MVVTVALPWWVSLHCLPKLHVIRCVTLLFMHSWTLLVKTWVT